MQNGKHGLQPSMSIRTTDEGTLFLIRSLSAALNNWLPLIVKGDCFLSKSDFSDFMILSVNTTALRRSILHTPVLVGRSTAKWESLAMVVSGNADQFGEGLSILSITITSTAALVG
jgi:hypothetical protein